MAGINDWKSLLTKWGLINHQKGDAGNTAETRTFINFIEPGSY